MAWVISSRWSALSPAPLSNGGGSRVIFQQTVWTAFTLPDDNRFMGVRP
jgi:hypothetical protein